ncbi:MAG: D-lyxose/D-mannose family sugar isomerase [Sedimentisphaerales bacterium]
MISEQYKQAVKRTLEYFKKAGIVLTDKEKENITVFDFDFNDLENVGLELLVYVNTSRVCAKELVLFPYQSCVEHLHPTNGKVFGKEETFRCRWGKVYLYVPGEPTKNIRAKIPANMKDYVTVFHEIELNPGQQYTLLPDTLHWFQAGAEGAVISEFSTTNTDNIDKFTDPRIKR